MRIWTAVLLLVSAVTFCVINPGRLELLRLALNRHIPAGLTHRLDYRLEGAGGLVGFDGDFLQVAIDDSRDPVERLGAAELHWLRALQEGEHGSAGDRFEGELPVLLDVASKLTSQPAACGLLADVLRAHRDPLRYRTGNAGRSEEQIAWEVVQLGLTFDPDNGYYHLLAAELELAAGKVLEARDSLQTAARAPRVDGRLQFRSAAAHRFLRSRGMAALEAREYLIGDSYPRSCFSIGEMFTDIAIRLGEVDAASKNGGEAVWVETYLALHEIGTKLARGSLLAEDALLAMRAEGKYLEVIRASDHRFDPPLPRFDARDGAELATSMLAAGRIGGAAVVRRNMSERRVFEQRVGERLDQRRRVVRTTSQMLKVTAAHGLLVSWALVCGVLTLLCGVSRLGLVSPKRRERERPSLPLVLACLAASAPIGLMSYLAKEGRYPFGPETSIQHWSESLGVPPLLLYAFPLVAIPVLLLPCVFSRRRRRLRSVLGVTGTFFAGYGAILLLVFVVSAPLIEDQRGWRSRALEGLLSDSYWNEGATWPYDLLPQRG